MIAHFEEISDDLKRKYGDIIHENVVLLLWLPRLYKSIKEQLPGIEYKIGFWDTFNLKDKNLSIIDVGNSSQVIDSINFFSVLGVKRVIAIGLAGSYDFEIGTIFIPEKAYNEDIIISHYSSEKICTFNKNLFDKNKEQIEKYTEKEGINA